MLELHYNRSLQPTDVVSSGGFRVGTIESDIQILNAVFGMTVEMGRDKSLSCGYVTPIGNGSDQQLDGELRVFFNWFFGGQNDRPRTLAGFID